MSRIPRDILERLRYFHREADGLFRRLFEEELGPRALTEEAPYPLVDVVEAADEILVRADLPDTDKGAIELYGAPNFVVIRGNKRPVRESSSYLRVERSFGPFQRLVVLPIPGDPSQVRARYDRGVLEVRIPKMVDRRQVHRQIPIE
jgi:HSP20 family protein